MFWVPAEHWACSQVKAGLGRPQDAPACDFPVCRDPGAAAVRQVSQSRILGACRQGTEPLLANPRAELNSAPPGVCALSVWSWKRPVGVLSADKGVHVPLTPLSRRREPLPSPMLRSPSSYSPSATTQPRRPRPVRALGAQGLARTPHSGLRWLAGGR